MHNIQERALARIRELLLLMDAAWLRMDVQQVNEYRDAIAQVRSAAGLPSHVY